MKLPKKVYNKNVVDLCLRDCRNKNHEFAGISNRNQCQCGSDFDKFGDAREEDCSVQCHETSGSQICGGLHRIAAYWTGRFMPM